MYTFVNIDTTTSKRKGPTLSKTIRPKAGGGSLPTWEVRPRTAYFELICWKMRISASVAWFGQGFREILVISKHTSYEKALVGY